MKFLYTVLILTLLISCQSYNKNKMQTAQTLKEFNESSKPVSTKIAFNTTEGKVISLQILKNQELEEHITKVSALLVCTNGNAVYSEETGKEVLMTSGSFIQIPENVKHKVFAHEDSNFVLIK